ncbi:MAG: hypothetical protein KF784_09445 [Fimbriimonadaceae bacterium]|nr:hypothetical protein [Fimbriimonadaceae bacterium]
MLIFKQRSLEVHAAQASLIGGSVLFAGGLAGAILGIPTYIISPFWSVMFGFLFALAGAWAFALFRIIKFDLRTRQYHERYGSGGWVRWRKGSIDEFKALELMAYQGLAPQFGNPSPPVATPQGPMAPPGTVFVIRLWSHDPYRHPMVLEHVVVGQNYGANAERAANFVTIAQMYSHNLKLPLYGSLAPQPWNPLA